MKRTFVIIFCCFITLLSGQNKPSQNWLDQKFSMFIHFGLYSVYGGVYDREPVTGGYSEQIQAFAGIFSDWYAATADQFNPVSWDPDAVVALAKKAGMRSIVFTSKHHDGFCMFHSLYTGFNIVEATPYGRDLMKELAEACERGGIGFGIYYSLIDWHFPQAYPISSHNADPLTPEHYHFNLKQVEEIMTRYGKISEIWFDMGSLTPEQSRGLYELVNRLQPECMISGRLGNDLGDFCVMADNEYPAYQLAVPWQTAASVFKETWGYRSWQQRGVLQPKIDEKIESLVHVIGRGGNYLLNIGPRGDGSIVDFEEALLDGVGRWVKTNSQAIYATRSNPFGRTSSWGEVTAKDDALYLFIKREFAGQQIDLPNVEGTVESVSMLSSGKETKYWSNRRGDRGLKIEVPGQFFSCIEVLKISFKKGYKIVPHNILDETVLTAGNAMPDYGYSLLNYYAGYKSLVAYNWAFVSKKKELTPEILFTENEKGKILDVEIDGTVQKVTLNSPLFKIFIPDMKSVKWENIYQKAGRGVFGFVPEESDEAGTVDPDKEWIKLHGFTYGKKLSLPLGQRRSVLFLQEIESDKEQIIAVEIGSGNAVYILLNGKYITAHFSPERVNYQTELVLLPLQKGKNQLIVKYYNGFEKELFYSITPLEEWKFYTQKLPPVRLSGEDVHSFSVRESNPVSKVSPLRMNNIFIFNENCTNNYRFTR